MHSRAARTPSRRARRSPRLALTVAIATAALVVAAAPGVAAAPEPQLPKPESPWTKPTKVDVPATPAGVTKAPTSRGEAAPPSEVAAWRAAQKARTSGGTTASGAAGTAAAAEILPIKKVDAASKIIAVAQAADKISQGDYRGAASIGVNIEEPSQSPAQSGVLS